jgi:hypothetical protein
VRGIPRRCGTIQRSSRGRSWRGAQTQEIKIQLCIAGAITRGLRQFGPLSRHAFIARGDADLFPFALSAAGGLTHRWFSDPFGCASGRSDTGLNPRFPRQTTRTTSKANRRGCSSKYPKAVSTKKSQTPFRQFAVTKPAKISPLVLLWHIIREFRRRLNLYARRHYLAAQSSL